MTKLSCCSHLDIGNVFIRWTLSTPNRKLMRRVRSKRSVPTPASTVKTVMSALKTRLCGCKGETISLVGALMAIAISSLAFWLSQPAHLFNGGRPPSASFAVAVAPVRPSSPPLTHGLLSLELLSAMQHASPRLTPYSVIANNKHCELSFTSATPPASREGRASSACTNRTSKNLRLQQPARLWPAQPAR